MLEDGTSNFWAKVRSFRDAHPPRRRYPSNATLDYPPATEWQLLATEQQLGFPIPAALRRFYAEVANGGIEFGPGLLELHGAIGGCPTNEWGQRQTIGTLVSRSGWQLHPRIEEALLRHPGTYIVSDTSPDRFIKIGNRGCGISIEINGHTGALYEVGCWGELVGDDGESQWLDLIKLEAQSFENWLERWMNGWRSEEWLEHQMKRTLADALVDHRELSPDLVDVSSLPDPDAVWKGLHCIGSNCVVVDADQPWRHTKVNG